MFLLPLVASTSIPGSGCCFFFLRDAADAVPRSRNRTSLSSSSRGRQRRFELRLEPSWTSPPVGHRHGRQQHGSRGAAQAGNGSGDTATALPAADHYCLTARDIRCVVLDIEGTTTPISFVADVLFPYARANVRAYLTDTYRTRQTTDDVALLRAQIDQDLADGVPGAVPVPPPPAPDEEAIDALVANVEAMIDADRKLPALKQLQGRVWRLGFDSGEIRGLVYDDVAEALARWHGTGVIRSYIYSSGSREAQRLIFGNTQEHGDLRRYLSAFFDTSVGGKRESRSYYEIWQTLGVDSPSQILFLTDVYQEATAARDAGFEVLISIRPGNAPLPDDHSFQTITSFAQISV
uniref:Uncharacterized protein n=1 Tax=Avena sativa TaxID=4498 RepID=A0ACD5X197_AVESA